MNQNQAADAGNINELISRVSAAKQWADQIKSGLATDGQSELVVKVQACSDACAAQLESLQPAYNLINQFGNLA